MSSIARSIIQKLFTTRYFPVRKTSYRYYPAPVKRFYRSVHVSESDGRYEISLDKRKLKTPSGTLLQLPNEALAAAIATEWDLQQKIIQRHNMHLTALCNTAIDNPCHQNHENIVDGMLQYLSSDTLCFRSNDPPSLAELQKEKWDPLLKWFENRYHVKINISEDVSTNPVPDETLYQLRKHLLSYSHWCLIGINFTAENLKSLILTLAVINHVIDVEKAVELSRLETVFQIQNWGSVEWAHNVDEAQLKARVAAGVLFTYLNEGSSDLIQKDASKKIQMLVK
ncbi:ATP synthase mitochondrial F1 complex assembly factor 2-like [Argiope bruennichi]|uniref:ATP synthase mitochondrial F1 complex like protein n=1 Tax=Argiope bruennichi TaxID=94029 RepID=A0A8T0FRT9_ARGBR|nr:ATP synthase mitochondrial F1 complex assembly factor 2-like [Argiope bruennichi]KAF8792409.1 ATP synthase mitochondrial F1 complex like protein [Argiope bruennichi]